MKRALMMIPAVLVAGAALAAGQAATTQANAPMRDGMGKQRMSALDTNKDGRISKAEAAAKPEFAARFDAMDANKDGYLDAADRSARQQQRFNEIDTNRDGKISQAEMKAGHEKMRAEHMKRSADREADMFKRLDTNNDGFISKEEMAAKHMGGMHGMRGHHDGKRGPDGGMKKPMPVPAPQR